MSRPPQTAPGVSAARDFAVAAHGFQKYGKRPYVFHLDQVAQLVRAHGSVFETVAYLHDVLEDTTVTEADLRERFGRQVSRAVSLISDPAGRTREERKAHINENLSGIEPHTPAWPALVVKVADRLCNVRMCIADDFSEQLQRYAKEYPAFRAAAWRPEFETHFQELETLLGFAPSEALPPYRERPRAPLDPEIAVYREHWGQFQALAATTASRLESRLIAAGIQCVVTHRAKSPERLRDKLQQRGWTPPPGRAALDAVRESVPDIVGIRVALYYPDDRELVDAIIRRNFDIKDARSHLGSQSLPPDYRSRFSGYWAEHYRVDAGPEHSRVGVEVQVASVLMYAWAFVTHDLAYKTLSGELSESELALIDQMNGIVLAAETAAEQLRKATRARVRRLDAELNNHFELGAWLTRWARSRGREYKDLGRVDRLYELLHRLDRLRPSAFEDILEQSDSRRPLADQAVERLLVSTPGLVENFPQVHQTLLERNPQLLGGPLGADSLDAARRLFEAWRNFELAAAQTLTGRRPASYPVGPKRIQLLPLDESTRERLKDAQRVYRTLARRPDRVDREQLHEAAEIVRRVSEALTESSD